MPAMDNEYPVGNSAIDTPRAAAAIVIGSLIALMLIKRGFRGVSAGGLSVGVR